MKLKTLLLAAAFVGGSFAAATAQSGMNQTPSGSKVDPTISAATHCMDKKTNQARLKSGTTASGSVGIQDKSARSSGASSQTSANATDMKLADC